MKLYITSNGKRVWALGAKSTIAKLPAEAKIEATETNGPKVIFTLDNKQFVEVNPPWRPEKMVLTPGTHTVNASDGPSAVSSVFTIQGTGSVVETPPAISFFLVNEDNSIFKQLTTGQRFNIADLPKKLKFMIRRTPTKGSVSYKLKNLKEADPDQPWTPKPGKFGISAVAFSESDQTGAFTAVDADFEILGQATPTTVKFTAPTDGVFTIDNDSPLTIGGVVVIPPTKVRLTTGKTYSLTAIPPVRITHPDKTITTLP